MDDTLKEQIKNIIDFNTKDLKREKGDFQFTDVGIQIDRIWEFLKDFSENEDYFETIPVNQQNDLRTQISRINDVFTQIKNFSPSEIPNPQDVRNDLVNQIQDIYSLIFNNLNQLDVYKLTKSGVQADFSNIKDEAKRTLEEAKKTKKNITAISESVKKTASRVPLYKYLGVFASDSDRHKKIANKWLIATFLLSLAVISVLLWLGLDFSKKIDSFDLVTKIYAFLILKLFFLAVMIYILQQSLRNYMAHMHLYVLNKHRENSLKVFDAMLKTVNDRTIADQVLSHLAQAIFESGETGFFPGKEVSKDGPDITQIFKDISKPK
jgi:hypothetical protein